LKNKSDTGLKSVVDAKISSRTTEVHDFLTTLSKTGAQAEAFTRLPDILNENGRVAILDAAGRVSGGDDSRVCAAAKKYLIEFVAAAVAEDFVSRANFEIVVSPLPRDGSTRCVPAHFTPELVAVSSGDGASIEVDERWLVDIGSSRLQQRYVRESGLKKKGLAKLTLYAR
jgi:hypothetical protein